MEGAVRAVMVAEDRQQAPRVCLVSEALGLPADEGVRKFAQGLLRGLQQAARTTGVAVSGLAAPPGVESVPANRAFVSRRLARRLRSLSPDLVVYVPSASGTLFSLWRGRVLKAMWPGARVALVCLQPRHLGRASRALGRALRPTVAFAQAPWTIGPLHALGCPVRFLPSGVDLERFAPVGEEEKEALRRRYGLPLDEFLLLHVGHVKPGRNLEVLVQAAPLARPVVVAGSSMGRDAVLARRLQLEAGAIVIDGYQERVQELYQACDCYLFPVEEPGNAIDAPLSVLEAMACNLPVISYPFGGLPVMFGPGPGLHFVHDWGQLPLLLHAVREGAACRTREMVGRYSWQEVARHLLAHALGVYAL